MKKLLLFLLALAWGSASAVSPDATISGTGTLYLTFDVGMGNHAEGVLFGRFVPDRDSLPHFPAVTSGTYPGPVTYITFKPTEQMLETLLGAAEAARLSQDRARIVRVPVTVVLKDYKPVVECDARSYHATVVSVKPLGHFQAASRDDAPIGC